jgi:uracil phosphoribosyltransferase
MASSVAACSLSATRTARRNERSRRKPTPPLRPGLRLAVARAAAADDEAKSEGEPERAKGPSTNQMLVFVPPHPLINHWLAIARNAMTPPSIFRSTLGELGRLLIYEAARDWLPTFSAEVEGPVGTATVEMVDPNQPIAVVPILRAGLVLLEEAKTVLPVTNTYHLGFARDEETLEAKMYLNKLPSQFPEGQRVLISDPMLATGGTIVKAIDECVSRGAKVSDIRVVCVVTCPPALTVLSDKYPGLRVYAAMIDEELNDAGYIIPGLGDAGDRAFGTE